MSLNSPDQRGYVFSIENGADNYPEIEPLYRQHYGEMQARVKANGVEVSDFNMRLDVYLAYWRAGHLINYVVRKNGRPVGYGNFYLTGDMHNGDLISAEDAIYMLPEHRNGTGRLLAKFIIADLKQRGVKRLDVTTQTDLRAVKLWERMGFKHTAYAMTYTF